MCQRRELSMPTTFRAYHPDQILLLAPDLREWVPEGHLSHQVSDLVDSLDLGSFYAPYEGDGRRNAPYEPSMMLKVLIYGYATGVYSSRAIARKLEEDVAFRMLAAGNFPQHRTICEFRRRSVLVFIGGPRKRCRVRKRYPARRAASKIACAWSRRNTLLYVGDIWAFRACL